MSHLLDVDGSNPWAVSSRRASSESLRPESYDTRLQSALGSRDESLGRGQSQAAEPYDVGDDSFDLDITIKDGARAKDDVINAKIPSPETYEAQLQDVIGSDEEEDEAGREDQENERQSQHGGYDASRNEEHLADASDELQARVSQGYATQADSSILTEDANSSLSSLSMRPARPWQFPAPRRLRTLRAEGKDGAVGNGSTSFDSSSILQGSPSVAESSEHDQEHSRPLMPYGDALAPLRTRLPTGLDTTNSTSFAPTQRSFVRISRLCGLSDREGSPTVLAVASGVVAVGTEQGRIGLYNRSRGWTGAIAIEGCISALAISFDNTFLAIGTTTGHIFLYDMAKLHAPARHVPPVSTSTVKAGRGEGHLPDSKIIHLSFVGARRTAVVSADEQGLSFYHSLGKILGVSSNDTLRILGRYASVLDQHHDEHLHALKSTVLGMEALPLGAVAHPSDSHHFVALLTPSKLVLVGLKPMPRTWFRSPAPKVREFPICGALAWLPRTMAPRGASHPTLAYSSGSRLFFLELVATKAEIEVRKLGSWKHDDGILALQWLSIDSLVIFSNGKLSLYDARRAQCTDAQSFPKPVENRWLPSSTAVDFAAAASASFKAHKGQLVTLTPRDIATASLVSWADRLLALVSGGDPLGAISLATQLLQDPKSGGSRIGLPEKYEEQRPIIASRLSELMRASTAYIFSENRMKDDLIHYENGVDRTPLFEGLARVCAQACIALRDYTFLFDELYDAFSEAGIEGIFADQMEDYIVTGMLKTLPVPIVKRLIDYRKRQERFDLAEIIIHNVDPTCLDLDQALSLCLQHHLYDALIHVYTRSLHDYVGPMIELLPFVKDGRDDAYRIFSYLSITLIGMTYPEQEVLEKDEGAKARTAVYSFVFSGRCVIWPEGAGGKLILTMDSVEAEPTYPYLRLFLNFDAEAFLDALDVAFEDTWLDDNNLWSRQKIVALLMDLDEPSHVAGIFIDIFIARNAPKYPQFIKLAPAQIDRLMTELSTSLLEDEDTRDDRQFAVECLLSTYQPAHTPQLIDAFERAGFHDILRRIFRREKRWPQLATLLVEQPTQTLFEDLNDVLRQSKGDKTTRANVLKALPSLVDANERAAVAIVQKHFSDHVDDAVSMLARSPHRQLVILDGLVRGMQKEKVSTQMRSLYISLLCSIRPHDVIATLDSNEADFFDLEDVAATAESEDVYAARLWALDKLGRPSEALQILDRILKECALILRADEDPDSSYNEEAGSVQDQVTSVARIAIRICSEHGEENLWIDLLQKLIGMAHDTQTSPSALSLSRALLQDALSAFVTSSGSEDLSFAQLFQRLVPEKGSVYSEVRDVSDAMMAAYRLRQDVLGMTNRLLDRNVFTALNKLTRLRRRGWRPYAANAHCSGCGKLCIGRKKDQISREQTSVRGRRGVSATFSADQLPLQYNPAYLEPAISPRPDKGKGVVRDVGQADADGDEHLKDSPQGNGRNSLANDYDLFASQDASGRVISTPAELFLTSPFGVDTANEDSDTIEGGDFRDTKAATSNGQHPANGGRDSPLDGEQTGESSSDGVVVCYDGQVYHRACAPAVPGAPS